MDNIIQFSQSCNRRRCSHCNSIVTDSEFSSSVTNESFSLKCSANCSSKDVIYLITCKKCKKQYVGQTHQQVSKRMNSHRFDVRNYDESCSSYSSNVAIHFNNNQHTFDDFSFMPIDIIHDNMERLCKETFWIHKLRTMYPEGLNSKVIYNT